MGDVAAQRQARRARILANADSRIRRIMSMDSNEALEGSLLLACFSKVRRLIFVAFRGCN